jgi:hypothetical protein
MFCHASQANRTRLLWHNPPRQFAAALAALVELEQLTARARG